MEILVSYDITSNRVRRKVFKLLKSYGRAIQFSVFYVDIPDGKVKILSSELSQILKHIEVEVSDTIVIVPLCNTCSNKIIQLGSSFKRLDCRQPLIV